MFTLTDLKQTRFYQDVFAEGKAEAETKAQAEAKQRDKALIFRLFSQGLATEDIATVFDLPVTEVVEAITEAEQEQSEPNQSS